MISRSTPLALAITLLGLNGAVLAQQQPAAAPAAKEAATATSATSAKPAADAAEITKVEIKAGSEQYDPRRDDTASKTVLTHEEIVKYGDTSVFDVLKRAPGVTVIGNSIGMRGLGSGYTQILVNGERPPPGFSMDTLTPDQIEKIEIVRAATAEHSMQAIAGSINIILKKVVSKLQRELRINTAYSEQQKNLFMIGTLADRVDSLSYYLNAMLFHNMGKSTYDSTEEFSAPAAAGGQVLQLRDKHDLRHNDSKGLGLQPRLNWNLPNDDQFNLSGFVQSFRYSNGNAGVTDNRIGAFPAPDYIVRDGDSGGHSRYLGADANWVAKLGGGKLDAKLGLSAGRSSSDSRSLSVTADGNTRLQRDGDSTSRNTNYNTSGKYTRTLFGDHALATGWEASSQLTEDKSLRVEGILGLPLANIDEHFSPKVTKLAAFIQDEWNITRQWSMYQGVRWESIRTDSSGTGLQDTQSRNSVLSPVAQTLYKFPDKSGRQLRLALTRTFKAPATNQLSARRYEADLNTRFTPDYSGNPNLKPELATGVDLTYEHFWSPGAVFSVGTSQRRITDYIRSKLTQDSRGYWLVQPLNDGNAQVRTLDVELKFPLKAVIKDAPAVDLRASANRNWSKVESVPGPDNRLDQQIPLSAVLGVDYRVDQYSAGASFSYRAGGPVRISEQQSTRLQRRRDLECYLLYKIRTGVQLRMTVSNALGEDSLGDSRYEDINGVNQTWSRTPASARFQANLELKF